MPMTILQIGRALTSALAIASALVAASVTAQADTLTKARESGTLRVGVANETPFAYMTPSGELTGFDIEVLRHITADMGIKNLEGSVTNFGGLIPGLVAKRFDLVTSAIYIRPDRCKQVAFAEPLYVLGDAVAVKAGNPKKIHSYKDIAADPTLKLANTAGGTGLRDNAKAMGVKDEQIVTIPDDASGYTAVKSGRADAYTNVAIVLETQLRSLNDPALERAHPFEQPVVDGKPRYGFASFAMRLEDKALLDEINKRLVAFRDTPEYAALMDKYALTPDDAVKPGMTTAKACTE
ncbi:ectoine/hydroxyectoine ABC transporter substrate-binding protein EhuB [Rhodoligotrophos defluvii]|uniref:ectoine/hydroxyectoine ABC transporter substrate-binding protein EhuB n=1 Tax=Rhodoligotrophos defluvii TaxID=2561934 RepID=UPI0010C99937|nr:ectoine/hydroxyectoine ABC transporter substrate-binding protein EhuB [Rhodoligotrophos defluvii]